MAYDPQSLRQQLQTLPQANVFMYNLIHHEVPQILGLRDPDSSATRETGYHSITMPQNEADQKPPLSLVEKLLLVSNMIAKASDVASGPLFVIKLLSKNAIQKDIFFIINIIALTLGALCSIANTKSCYVAMLALKGRPELQNTAIEDPKSDRATVDYQEKTPLYTPKSSIFSTDERSDGSMEEPEEVAIIQSINDEPSDLKPAEKPSGILGRMYSLFEGVAEKPSGIFQRLSHWGFFKKPVVTEQTKPAVEGGYDAI